MAKGLGCWRAAGPAATPEQSLPPCGGAKAPIAVHNARSIPGQPQLWLPQAAKPPRAAFAAKAAIPRGCDRKEEPGWGQGTVWNWRGQCSDPVCDRFPPPWGGQLLLSCCQRGGWSPELWTELHTWAGAPGSAPGDGELSAGRGRAVPKGADALVPC